MPFDVAIEQAEVLHNNMYTRIMGHINIYLNMYPDNRTVTETHKYFKNISILN